MNVWSNKHEQLCEREHTIHELERKMEEKDKELHSIKLHNEAICMGYTRPSPRA
ncbi:hypothetical protein JHK82_055522 [Glycine max]|nr:hypothetical protein JHK82_055522 [Glycine max]